MYRCMARYSKVFAAGERISRIIVFDGNLFGSEKECYMYAVEAAYAMAKFDERLERIEVIDC